MSAISSPSWKLPDGRLVQLRPIESDDFQIEKTFLSNLSPEAGYRRLFSMRKPSEQEVRRWTDIDTAREVAFVVTTLGTPAVERMLAVGRMVQDDDKRKAEFALLVGDDCKRQGIGRRLLAELVQAARARNLQTIYGLTLSENTAMLALCRIFGFTVRREIGDSMITMLSLHLIDSN